MSLEVDSSKAERAHQKFLLRASLRKLCLRLFILYFLIVTGAFLFRWAESLRELEFKCGVKKVRRDFLDSLWQGSQSSYMKEEDWKSLARRRLLKFEEELHEAFEAGINSYSGQKSWSFLNAVFYAITIITTIGYGHITPITTLGKILTVLYALIGIPVFTIILGDATKVLTRGLKLYLTRKSANKGIIVDDEFHFPLSTASVILLLYSVPGTLFFYFWETSWGLAGSFYFFFVSTSTIGFGDLVPQSPLIVVLLSLYFLFGLALTAGVLGLIQEKMEGILGALTEKVGDVMGITKPVAPVNPTSRSESESEYYKED